MRLSTEKAMLSRKKAMFTAIVYSKIYKLSYRTAKKKDLNLGIRVSSFIFLDTEKIHQSQPL